MNELKNFANSVASDNESKELIKQLYLVMKVVGGYEQLMNLPIPAVDEILKCIKWEEKQKAK